MSDQTKQVTKELKTTLVILLIFVLAAAFIISFYSRVDIVNALQTVLMQILNAGTAGTVGVLGNIFYVVIIFLTLGVTFYMFERVIILLSEVRLGGILMKASLSTIKGHYIVCGGGNVGMHVAERLKKEGKKVVIIENDCPTVEFLRNRGYNVLEGDCMNEETLEKAKIRTARGILACTGKDSVNIFLVLTSKDLNPGIRVATRVNNQNARNEFTRAGADIIVTPDITGGYELADKIIGKK
jgi:voltage-gated potassium channel